MMIMAECQDVIFDPGVIFGMSRAGVGVGLVDPCGSLPSIPWFQDTLQQLLPGSHVQGLSAGLGSFPRAAGSPGIPHPLRNIPGKTLPELFRCSGGCIILRTKCFLHVPFSSRAGSWNWMFMEQREVRNWKEDLGSKALQEDLWHQTSRSHRSSAEPSRLGLEGLKRKFRPFP